MKNKRKYFIEPSDKIKFIDERNSYTVRALNDRFAVCTKRYCIVYDYRF